RGQFLQKGVMYGPRYREYVERAIERELQKQSVFFFRVLDRIQDVFLEFRPSMPKELDVLPDATKTLSNDLDFLEAQNTDLQLELNMERGQLRALNAFAAAPVAVPGDAAADDTPPAATTAAMALGPAAGLAPATGSGLVDAANPTVGAFAAAPALVAGPSRAVADQ
ncbi:hypothetical protein TRAPUB_13859, partial [Trametes pubescens]